MLSFEEDQLLALYDTGTRDNTIDNLERMKQALQPDEQELRSLTERVLEILRAMSDKDFEKMKIFPYLGPLEDCLDDEYDEEGA
ncbi:MAG: hypothetical protein IJJ99_07530 [Oscillospiraceae bacterium]|nr:hypothetical protein [Oscillospiraceae bacterium]